jgi:hypothetical protein
MNVLTADSQVKCPHGGQATLTTSNDKVEASDASVLLETDVHTVAGCPFTLGPKYSPCVSIRWSGGASKVMINGIKVLTQSSSGKCYSAESAVQGVAVVANTQIKVTAQ